MKDFKEVSPEERMVFIAKVYHNIWYCNDRYRYLEELIKEWENNPIREYKLLNQFTENGTN